MSNTKKNSFRCDNLDKSEFELITDLKKTYYPNITNKEFFLTLIAQHITLAEETNKKINELVSKTNSSRNELLAPIIERYINKTLKGYGIVKDKNQKSVDAENELEIILKDMVAYYEPLPLKERRFITASMVNKFIYKHQKEKGYHSKHINVIKRVLMSKIDFIEQYHKKYNLSVHSNYIRGNK